MKNHLKSLAAPKSWKFARKRTKFITRPLPGKHKLAESVSLNFVLQDMLGHAKLKKEVKEIINKGGVTIDAKKAHTHKHNVGLFDVLDFPTINETYRILFNQKGNLEGVKIPSKEKLLKPLKVIGKRKLKGGKTQLNLYDGTNLLAEKDSYEVGDSVMYNVGSKKIESHIPLRTGTYIFVVDGKHKGKQGVIENIMKSEKSEDIIIFKKDNIQYSTAKKYAYAVGEKESAISLGDRE